MNALNRLFITVLIVGLVALLQVFIDLGPPFPSPAGTVATEQQGQNSSGINSAMSQFRAVFVTVPSIEVGKKIASGLVSQKLAACVNIIPQITSIYEWEGKINEDTEQLLMIKTQSHLFEDLSTFVKQNHPYDVPEIIGVPIEQGSKSYLDWISQITKRDPATTNNEASSSN